MEIQRIICLTEILIGFLRIHCRAYMATGYKGQLGEKSVKKKLLRKHNWPIVKRQNGLAPKLGKTGDTDNQDGKTDTMDKNVLTEKQK